MPTTVLNTGRRRAKHSLIGGIRLHYSLIGGKEQPISTMGSLSVKTIGPGAGDRGDLN